MHFVSYISLTPANVTLKETFPIPPVNFGFMKCDLNPKVLERSVCSLLHMLETQKYVSVPVTLRRERGRERPTDRQTEETEGFVLGEPFLYSFPRKGLQRTVSQVGSEWW